MDDFILNGAATGSVASRLIASNCDVSVLRPWIGKDQHSYISVVRNGEASAHRTTQNAATLRKDEWIQLDSVVIKAARSRLKFVNDLRSQGLVYTIPNGMGKTVLQSESMSDINSATISMDGVRQGANDRPQFDIVNLPLPIIHKDFSFSARQIATSRNSGSPLDTSMAELSARKVAEEVEKLAIGVADTYSFGGGSIYGMENYPDALTKELTDPTDTGWTPLIHVTEVLAMRQQAQDAYYYGPYSLYYSSKWDKYLDADYSSAYPGVTLRDRLKKIEGINGVSTLDYMTDYSVGLVQMTSDIIRMVNGMDITTVQWESNGGMQINFKVMAILVPQIRCDYNSRTGLVQGSI